MNEQPQLNVTESVHQVATSLEDQTEKLESFKNEIGTIADQVERMDERERDAFYSNAESLREQLENIDTVEEILELDDEIDELVRSPLREAALSELEEFLNIVEPQLSGETRSEIRNRIRDSVPEDLEEISDSYEELTPRVEALPSFVQDAIQDAIEGRASILVDPASELTTVIDTLERRRDTLQEFDNELSKAGDWTPERNLTEERRFYKSLNSVLASGQMSKSISDIDQLISVLEGYDNEYDLQISNLVRQELERELEEVEPDSLSNPFKNISGELRLLHTSYENIVEWISDLESFGTDRGLYETRIDSLIADYRQLQIRTYDSVMTIRKRCQSIEDDIKEFITDCTEQLNIQRRMIPDVEEELSDIPSPNINFEADETDPVTEQTVREDLINALNAILTYDEWFENAFSELDSSFDTEDALKIWHQLYDGESVVLTEENKDTILALADLFSIRVTLSSA